MEAELHALRTSYNELRAELQEQQQQQPEPAAAAEELEQTNMAASDVFTEEGDDEVEFALSDTDSDVYVDAYSMTKRFVRPPLFTSDTKNVAFSRALTTLRIKL